MVNVVTRTENSPLPFTYMPVETGLYYHRYRISYFSAWLNRLVELDFLKPGSAAIDISKIPVLILNDGQDLQALNFLNTIDNLEQHVAIEGPFLTLAIHAGNRLDEYGVSGIPDYQRRGSLAHLYHLFLAEELIGIIMPALGLVHAAKRTFIAGCSLGGLAALDFAWQHPGLVAIAGAFSGSFWWRSKALDKGYTDADRIMHTRIRETLRLPDLGIWLQAGTWDEENDRHGRGVIDTIGDIHDLMAELLEKGFPEGNLHYKEVREGRHDQQTWGKAMPDFLAWAFDYLKDPPVISV